MALGLLPSDVLLQLQQKLCPLMGHSQVGNYRLVPNVFQVHGCLPALGISCRLHELLQRHLLHGVHLYLPAVLHDLVEAGKHLYNLEFADVLSHIFFGRDSGFVSHYCMRFFGL